MRQNSYFSLCNPTHSQLLIFKQYLLLWSWFSLGQFPWVLSQKQKVRETSTPPLSPPPDLAVRLCSGVTLQPCTPSHPSHQSRASKTFSHWSRTLTGWLRHTCQTWERGRVPSRSYNRSENSRNYFSELLAKHYQSDLNATTPYLSSALTNANRIPFKHPG